MKSLIQYILEYKTNDVIKIFDKGKEIVPQEYFYDKESFDEMIVQNNFTNKTLKLVQKENNRWNVLSGDAHLDTLKPNGEYLVQGNIKLTYDELIDNLENGKYILIIL